MPGKFDFILPVAYEGVNMAGIKHFLCCLFLALFFAAGMQNSFGQSQPAATPASTNKSFRAVPSANPKIFTGNPRTNTPVSETISGTSTNASSPAAPVYRMPPNTILETILPLTPTARVSVQASKNPMVQTVREAIAVPYGFSPTNLNKILIVSGTSDGEASSIRAMRAFTNIALRLGWVVIAADGPHGKPPQDNPPWRWAMLSTVLDHIHTAWPDSRKWPIACAGFSGGAKWSAIMGAILSQKNYHLVGVFMAGCNQDMASEAARLYWPATKYKKTPMFLSSGSEDSVATPAHHASVKESMLDNGFFRVRLESFKGGHELDQQTLRTALYWFFDEVVDQRPMSNDPTRSLPQTPDPTPSTAQQPTDAKDPEQP